MSEPPPSGPRESMVAPLHSTIDQIMSRNVQGVVVADKDGICVAARGSLDPSNATRFANIYELSTRIVPENEQPVICIETESSQLVISYADGLCTTLCAANAT